jgi:hypothetical protein
MSTHKFYAVARNRTGEKKGKDEAAKEFSTFEDASKETARMADKAALEDPSKAALMIFAVADEQGYLLNGFRQRAGSTINNPANSDPRVEVEEAEMKAKQFADSVTKLNAPKVVVPPAPVPDSE